MFWNHIVGNVSYTTLRIRLMSPNFTLFEMVEIMHFMLCEFYHPCTHKRKCKRRRQKKHSCIHSANMTCLP